MKYVIADPAIKDMSNVFRFVNIDSDGKFSSRGHFDNATKFKTKALAVSAYKNALRGSKLKNLDASMYVFKLTDLRKAAGEAAKKKVKKVTKKVKAVPPVEIPDHTLLAVSEGGVESYTVDEDGKITHNEIWTKVSKDYIKSQKYITIVFGKTIISGFINKNFKNRMLKQAVDITYTHSGDPFHTPDSAEVLLESVFNEKIYQQTSITIEKDGFALIYIGSIPDSIDSTSIAKHAANVLSKISSSDFRHIADGDQYRVNGLVITCSDDHLNIFKEAVFDAVVNALGV